MIILKTLLLLPLILLTGCALHTLSARSSIEAAHPPAGEFIEVDGIRMHYVDTGTPASGASETVVLVHGASSNLLDLMVGLGEELRDDFRVIAFDRPGFGYSERPEGDWPDPGQQAALMHSALAEMGIDRVTIVGHSWGGSLAMAYGLNHPASTRAVVLLSGATHPWWGGVSPHYLIGNTPLLGPLYGWNLYCPLGHVLIRPVVAGIFTPNDMPDAYIEDIGAKLALRPGTYVANSQDMAELSDFLDHQKSRYSTLKPPLLMLWGGADRSVPSKVHAQPLLELLPNAQFKAFDGVGHALHHVSKESIAEEIRQLLQRPLGNSETLATSQ